MSDALLAPLRKRSFTIEQLLAPDASVFFENIFSTRHIGRVVDFMLHQCRDFLSTVENPGQTEYRFRQALELLVFNAWTNYRAGERAKCVEIEFGADKGRLVFSVSYVADADLAGFVPGSGRPANVASARTVKMLTQVQALVDGLIVRHNPEAGRVQTIAFLTGTESEKLAKPEYLDVATLPEDAEPADDAAPAGVAEPGELSTGELDAFLADENAPSPGQPGADQGLEQTVVGAGSSEDPAETAIGATSQDGGQVTTVTGSAEGSGDAITRVAGGTAEDEGETDSKISGETDEPGVDKTRIGGGSAEDPGADKTRIGGGSAEDPGAGKTRIGGGPAEDPGAEKTRIGGGPGKDLGADKTVTRIGGGPGKDLGADKTVTRIGGGPGKDLGADKTVARIGGGPGKDLGADKAVTRIGGGPGKDLGADKTVTRISGGPAPDSGDDTTAIRVSGGTEPANAQRTAAMQVRRPAGAAAQAGEAAGPSRREKLLEGQLKTLQAQIEALKSEKQDLQDRVVESGRQASAATAALENQAVTDEIEEKEEDKPSELTRYKQEIESGAVPEAAKAWATGMMETAVKERAELRQKMHEVDGTLRKREHEFKTKEIALNEQLRALDATLKSRESALEKAKQSAAVLSTTLDKLREEHADSQDRIELTHKLVTAEKLLAAEKEISERNQKRLDELQKKVSEEVSSRGSAQQDATKAKKQVEDLQRKITVLQEQGNKGSAAEIQNLTEQRDKNARMVDECKRQIRELQSKLSAATSSAKASGGSTGDKKGTSSQSEAELKHKIELAEKLAKSSKDELDKVKKRFEEVKGSETKLRGEISKLQGELAKAQADLKAAGIRSATAAANAPKPAGSKPGVKK